MFSPFTDWAAKSVEEEDEGEEEEEEEEEGRGRGWGEGELPKQQLQGGRGEIEALQTELKQHRFVFIQQIFIIILIPQLGVCILLSTVV